MAVTYYNPNYNDADPFDQSGFSDAGTPTPSQSGPLPSPFTPAPTSPQNPYIPSATQPAMPPGYQINPTTGLYEKIPAATTPAPPPGSSTPKVTGPDPTNGFPDLKFNFTPPPGPTAPGAVAAVPVPQFNAPDYKQAPAFELPSWQSVQQNDPGIAFRIGQGEQQVQQSAAARGVLNGGGTLKDILNYGQNAASNEYQNAAIRALGTYQTNYGTQFADPNQYAYNAAVQAFQPYQTQYGAEVGAAAAQPQLDWNNAFNLTQANYNTDRNNEQDKFNRLFSFSQSGAT